MTEIRVEDKIRAFVISSFGKLLKLCFSDEMSQKPLFGFPRLKTMACSESERMSAMKRRCWL